MVVVVVVVILILILNNFHIILVVSICGISGYWVQATICLRGFTLFSDDLPISCFEEKSIKTMLPGVAFFNLINGIFRVFYKKFDLIILKIWSLLLFSQSVRELMGDWKERSVNRPRREWVPSDKSLHMPYCCVFPLKCEKFPMGYDNVHWAPPFWCSLEAV